MGDVDWMLGMIPGLVIGMVLVIGLQGGPSATLIDGYVINNDYPIEQTICNNPSDFDYELPSQIIKDCVRMTQGEVREYWKEVYMLSCNPIGC